MTPCPFEQTKAELAELGGQRVWSLMVTLFGDLAQAEGDAIRGPDLSAIMSAMDIRPEAVRVALHRLRNDGWITSVKSGRTSSHSLTEISRAETVAASARIYAAPSDAPPEWQMVVLEEAGSPTTNEMLGLGYAPLAPRLYIGSVTAQHVPGAALSRGVSVPGWMRTQLEPAELAQDYADLCAALERADARLADARDISALEQAVLRCLVVHNWRRLVLKHADLPAGLYSEDWKGHACHVLVHRLLTRFPRPSLDDIAAG